MADPVGEAVKQTATDPRGRGATFALRSAKQKLFRAPLRGQHYLATGHQARLELFLSYFFVCILLPQQQVSHTRDWMTLTPYKRSVKEFFQKAPFGPVNSENGEGL